MNYQKVLVLIPMTAVVLTGCQSSCYDDSVLCETYVHRYGVPMAPEEWCEHGSTGQVCSVRTDGVEITKCYEEGVQHGETSYTYPHRSTVQKVENYDRGQLTKEQTFFATGVLKSEVEHVSPTSRLEKVYYDHGAQCSVETYEAEKLQQGKYYNLNGNVESGVENGSGKRTNRDEFGILQSVDTIKDGQMVLRTTYHPNNIPKEQICYAGGRIHGTVRTFMPAGDPKTIEQWVGGVQEGITECYQDGEKVADVPYQEGVRSGVERRYADCGKRVVEEVTWVNGLRHGPAFRYVNGEVVQEWFFQDRKVTHDAFERMSGPRMI